MSDRATIEHRDGDFGDGELEAIISTLTGVPAEQICETHALVIYHPEPGEHAIGIVAGNTLDAEHVAGLLRHAADHLLGSCRHCARRNRKAGRYGR